jgi:hypothetical protein
MLIEMTWLLRALIVSKRVIILKVVITARKNCLGGNKVMLGGWLIVMIKLNTNKPIKLFLKFQNVNLSVVQKKLLGLVEC